MFAALFTDVLQSAVSQLLTGDAFLFLRDNIVVERDCPPLIRRFLRSIRRRIQLKHILLVGYSRAAEQYIDRIQQGPQWGYNVTASVDD